MICLHLRYACVYFPLFNNINTHRTMRKNSLISVQIVVPNCGVRCKIFVELNKKFSLVVTFGLNYKFETVKV